MKLTFSNGSGLLNLGNGDIPVSSLDLPFQADGIFFDDFGQHYVKFIGAGHVLMTADEIAATVAYLEGLPARPSSDYELTSTGWQIPAGALETAKAAQWEIVKAARDAVIYGGFTYNGGTYDSDQISQSRIQGAVQLAAIATQSNQPFSLVWTLADNSTVTLDAPERWRSARRLEISCKQISRQERHYGIKSTPRLICKPSLLSFGRQLREGGKNV